MSSTINNFIIFAHARSGSSNLLQALQLHPALNISEEPFHPEYHTWNPEESAYIDLIHDILSLEQQLVAIFSKYNGMKVLDYQLPEVIYTHMLLKPAIKIISLKRQNILQSAVSNLIAQQTGIWKIWDKTAQRAKKYENMKPLSLTEIERLLSHTKAMRRTYTRVLTQKPPPMHLELIYEEIYSSDANRNVRAFGEIYEFLGVSIDDVESDRLNYFITPHISKINSEQTYSLLPNAEEIHQKFSCDENGWLFPPPEQ